MSKIIKKLKGEDLRSIGKVQEVVLEILENDYFIMKKMRTSSERGEKIMLKIIYQSRGGGAK